jgi:hypothetical protein
VRVLMGVIQDRHGTYCAQQKVPEKLQVAVARVLDNGKATQKYLKRSLRTKDIREANIRAKPVLAEFDRIIAKAKSLAANAETPTTKRTSLNAAEIARMAEHVYAEALAWDERVRFGGRDEMKRIEAEVVRVEGAVGRPLIPHEHWPQRGMPRTVFEENRAALADTLRAVREAAARGDISVVLDEVMLALAAFNIELDEHSQAYIKLSNACLQAHLRALEASRSVTLVSPWKHLRRAGQKLTRVRKGIRCKTRSKAGNDIDRGQSEQWMSSGAAVQLHGDMAVAGIRKKHALEYRKALQDVPRLRRGDLLRAAHQTVALDIVRRSKTTPIHELERYMRCRDCSQVRGYAYKRSHLVALRATKISASDPTSTWWPGQR